jgi:hypothetical protein
MNVDMARETKNCDKHFGNGYGFGPGASARGPHPAFIFKDLDCRKISICDFMQKISACAAARFPDALKSLPEKTASTN